MGAAIQAGVLRGEVRDVLLLDVTPLSLGIETLGGVFTKLIEKNTTISTRKSQVFTRAADNQTSVEIHVLQGEREMAANNKTLGRFQLLGIPPALRGLPQIEVTFDIDANGIVNVSAKDMGTGREQSIKITASSGLTEEEIERLVRDAAMHAQEDRKKRDLADARNKADSLIYSTEKSVKEMGDKLDGSNKREINQAIAELKKATEGENSKEIERLTERLTQASYKLAETVYARASQQQQARATGSRAGAANDEDVVDADFEEVQNY